MGWISDLYQTYENHKDEVAKGVGERDYPVLLPVAHTTQNAQIVITLNEKGEFIEASRVNEEDKITVIPASEDSETRGSGIAPHPLEDNLGYIAGDYTKYTNKDNSKKYKKYMEDLNAWCHSNYSHWKIEAIRDYLEKGTILGDLINEGIIIQENEKFNKIEQNKQGKLTKTEIKDISKEFIVFKVQKYGILEDAVYKDTELFNLYTQYYMSLKTNKNLCYITGEQIPYSRKHSTKIRYTGDKAKLISSNEPQTFTYKGRFISDEEVATIGYETSQKAHRALRWLITKQGFSIGEMSVVAWELKGRPIPSIEKNTQDIFKLDLLSIDEINNKATTNESYARKIKEAAYGYRNKLTDDDKSNHTIRVIAVEAATTGRLSVNFYEEITNSLFMDHIENWHITCAWCHPINEDKKKFCWIGAPSLQNIAELNFGKQTKQNTKFIKKTIERLLPCIIDGKHLPKDIMKLAVNRVSNRYNFNSRDDYNKAIAIVCALVRKTENDKGVEWKMALDRENRDRSYVFGRLLGAAQKLEEIALYYKGEPKRETAAERFSTYFVKKPAQTLKIIHSYLQPYISYLKSEGKTSYYKEYKEIYDLIDYEDFKSKKPLSEVYLLGYNCQLNSYNKQEKYNHTLEDTKNE